MRKILECHCEERSDEAISRNFQSSGDRVVCRRLSRDDRCRAIFAIAFTLLAILFCNSVYAEEVKEPEQNTEQVKTSSILPEGGGEGAAKAEEKASPEPSLILPVNRMRYSWAARKIDDALWGMAIGNLDGDGVPDVVLLKRKEIKIGRFAGNKFEQRSTCKWPGIAEAAKIYLMDINDDGDDEIILSAVSEGAPASLILDYDGTGCQVLARDVRWSLRVALLPMKILVGQWWNSESFFSGPIYELAFSKGKIRKGRRLDLPWNTRLFQFTPEPDADGKPSVILQQGYERLRVKTKRGKHFKKSWQSGERFGGTINYLPAVERRAMGDVKSDYVYFGVPPVVVWGSMPGEMLAVHHDLPLSGFVGKHPYVRGAEIVGFKRDPALGFIEDFRTLRLSGAVIDMFFKTEGGKRKLYVLMQEGGGFFSKSTTSIIFTFDLQAN